MRLVRSCISGVRVYARFHERSRALPMLRKGTLRNYRFILAALA